jgi:hypothetical protein
MQNNAIDHDNIHRKVEYGLDFILSHFQEPLFPRKIMTKQLGYQVEIFNKEEALVSSWSGFLIRLAVKSKLVSLFIGACLIDSICILVMFDVLSIVMFKLRSYILSFHTMCFY